jgi:hypothetical protein
VAQNQERKDKVRDKDKTAHQQTHDHEIAWKAVHDRARELFDAVSDFALVKELCYLSFGHASLRFLWLDIVSQNGLTFPPSMAN